MTCIQTTLHNTQFISIGINLKIYLTCVTLDMEKKLLLFKL